MEFTYFNMALTLFLVAISKYVGKNVRSRGPIACEEMPKGSRPKETNPINQDAATCDFAFEFSWTGPETRLNAGWYGEFDFLNRSKHAQIGLNLSKLV